MERQRRVPDSTADLIRTGVKMSQHNNEGHVGPEDVVMLRKIANQGRKREGMIFDAYASIASALTTRVQKE